MVQPAAQNYIYFVSALLTTHPMLYSEDTSCCIMVQCAAYMVAQYAGLCYGKAYP